MTSDCYVVKFRRCSEDGKHLMRLQSEISVFKFLHRSVNGVLVLTHVFSSKEGGKVARKLEEKIIIFCLM